MHDRARHLGLEPYQGRNGRGLYGIGEAYWGWGVKDLVINKMKGILVGEDPLNVDKLYGKMLMETPARGPLAG